MSRTQYGVIDFLPFCLLAAGCLPVCRRGALDREAWKKERGDISYRVMSCIFNRNLKDLIRIGGEKTGVN